jgi:hypothetical protein
MYCMYFGYRFRFLLLARNRGDGVFCTPYAIKITVDSCSAVHKTPGRGGSHLGSADRAIQGPLGNLSGWKIMSFAA